jgi:hypothetical protein
MSVSCPVLKKKTDTLFLKQEVGSPQLKLVLNNYISKVWIIFLRDPNQPHLMFLETISINQYSNSLTQFFKKLVIL